LLAYRFSLFWIKDGKTKSLKFSQAEGVTPVANTGPLSAIF